MRECDFRAFAALLDDVAALLPPPQPLGPTARAMFFRALAAHPLEAVQAALDAHVKDPQRGRWFPKPADLIAQLQGLASDDGRPGAEEAWSMALVAADEDATVVWTDEMAQAWGRAQPVFALGDRIGARMAFREAYERLTTEARAERRPVRWTASEGHDPRQRAQAIAAAVADGRLPQSEHLALPAPANAMPLLLIGGTEMQSQAEREGRQRLRELRDRIAAKAEAPTASDVQPAADTSEARAVLADAAARMRASQ